MVAQTMPLRISASAIFMVADLTADVNVSYLSTPQLQELKSAIERTHRPQAFRQDGDWLRVKPQRVEDLSALRQFMLEQYTIITTT